MIRDMPPLAVERLDPWEKIQIDPATRRLAEDAAAAAGLAVEEWLERAIRRACPSAFRNASVTNPTPPLAAVLPAQRREIETSLGTLLARTERQQLPQPARAQHIVAPVEPRRAVPVELAPAQTQSPPVTPIAEPAAVVRRAPTIAERLAQQRVAEAEDDTTAQPLRHDEEKHNDRDGLVENDDAAPTLPLPPSSPTRLAIIAVAIALAMTAGAVTAQYLTPGHSRAPVAPRNDIATSTPSDDAAPPSLAALPPSPAPEPSVAPPPAPPSEASATPTAAVAKPEKPEAAAPIAATMPATATATATATIGKAAAPTTSPEVVPPAPAKAEAAPTKTAVATILPRPSKTDDIAPSDPKALAPWLEQRAKSGDAIAQYRLGVLYALGQGIQQDYQHAAQLFKTSAEGGVAEAQYNIAVMYGEGLGIGRDPAQAVQWYQKAAAQGNANAAFNLGVVYSNGVGISQSMDQAAQWFRRAATAGIVNAQFNLGLLYERGDGVPVSQVEAYAWYSAAAGHGDSGAAQRRDRLASTLAPATLKEAQALARQVAAMIKNSGTNTAGGLATGNATKASASKP